MSMRRIVLALVPVLALVLFAGVIGRAKAQFLPPNRYFGTVTLNGAAPPAGTTVTAFIAGKACGAGQVTVDGRYTVDVDDATRTPGCGTMGAAVTFQIGSVRANQMGTYQQGFFTPLDLTAGGPVQRWSESALLLGDPRPCIPDTGQTACDPNRAALWNGEAAAWAARGITDGDARFNETVVFRVRAGDPAAIGNIARFLEAPYLQITRVRYAGSDEFIEITNLGGGDQEMTGWTVRSPARNLITPFPAGFVMNPSQTCRVYASGTRADSCGSASFNASDIFPDDRGEAVLFYDALALLGADTFYSADPNNQPPPPNLQGVQ